MTFVDPSKITTATGPMFIVIILNWALFGVLSIQIYLYSQAFPNDKPTLKTLVFGIYLLEMVQTLLLTETVWTMLASGFGNIDGLDNMGTTWFSICFIGGLVGFFVQWFYAYRIAIISQKRIIPGFVALMSLISLAGALASTSNVKRVGRFSELVIHHESWTFAIIGLWAATGSVCDVVIATCMCYYLRRRTQYGRFSQTYALVSKLVRMTIETGVLTASVSFLTLVLYYPPGLRNFVFYGVPLSIQAKLYSNTMLAVLNSRMKLGIISESATWQDDELVFASPCARDTNTAEINIASRDIPLRNTNVFVAKEQVTTTDDSKKQVYSASAPILSIEFPASQMISS